MTPRFIMIGGFLGAGKTTTVGRLARRFTDQGLKVGIVTNDQTTDLVDTHSLRSQGFDVGEVAGACFCCNFNELTSTVEKLTAADLPDVILAEPVGSCTDLVATVIRPLVQVYKRPFDVAPYGVILKPSHGLKILRNDGQGGFSQKADYIFRKQLEEADFLIINRIDELTPEAIAELTGLLESQFPGRPIVRISAKAGLGFDSLCEILDQRGAFAQRVMELDYDIYAEGEAELGWLNSQAVVEAEAEFELDRLLVDLIDRLRQRFADVVAETAHLKTIGLWEGFYGVANLVSSFTEPELSLPSNCRVKRAHVVVNARVAIDPEVLAGFVREELAAACQAVGATHRIDTLQSFRPGRPVPTHRITTAVS
ncbi:MAG: cobalamin biosynthesis protein P47K [Planctomycetota bacterium]|nr:cobalamin biosynthesis protein P47K [Planctomycetota bacterium]